MQAFTRVEGIVAPMPQVNIDTNQICPTRFNKAPRGPGHARILFHDQRFEADGREKNFVLNREPWRMASAIAGGRNFGCGSSRESAVYALWEFGIRCVIAESFGDIFAANCAKNGLLTVALPEASMRVIFDQIDADPEARVTVDLESQTVTDAAGGTHRFDIHPVRKRCLLLGLDDIDRTRQYGDQIAAHAAAWRERAPWMTPPAPGGAK